jgi:hypothetical protein
VPQIAQHPRHGTITTDFILFGPLLWSGASLNDQLIMQTFDQAEHLLL